MQTQVKIWEDQVSPSCRRCKAVWGSTQLASAGRGAVLRAGSRSKDCHKCRHFTRKGQCVS